METPSGSIPNRFPSDFGIDLTWDSKEKQILTGPNGDLDLSEVGAVWLRHIAPAAQLPDDMEPDHRAGAKVVCEEAVWGLLQCQNAFQLDPYDVLESAPTKPRQLQLARALGLEIPRTLITNRPETLRTWVKGCPGGVIVKMLNSGSVTVEGEHGDEPIYARVLEPDELDDLDGLVVSPMIFQERVEKALELRVTVVGSKVFVAAVDPGGSSVGASDWRRDPKLVGAFRAHAPLPAAWSGGSWRSSIMPG